MKFQNDISHFTIRWHYRKPRKLLHAKWQGLTQTFMSSGQQDHQLRGPGGPTIFLVVLTTTNVTALVNLESIVFTLAMCFHIQ